MAYFFCLGFRFLEQIGDGDGGGGGGGRSPSLFFVYCVISLCSVTIIISSQDV